MKKLLTGVVMALLSLQLTAMAKAPEKNHCVDPDKAIMLSAKQPSFRICLPSNPGSTGYRWYLQDFNPAIIALDNIKEKFTADTSGKVGAGGQDVWTFTLKKHAVKLPLTTKVTLVYARGWEKDPKDTTIKVLTIVVNP